MPDYFPIDGERIEISDLTLRKARDLVTTITSEYTPYTTLIDCYRLDDGHEVIVFDTEVERGQKTVHDIRFMERVSVCFWTLDDRIPEVLALREDFPCVPHLNLREHEFPRSLCLYDHPYEENQLHWTSFGFLQQIRRWLSLSAEGRLHAEDQPLEPLLIGTEANLIIPSGLLYSEETQFLRIKRADTAEGERKTYFAEKLTENETLIPETLFVALLVKSKPQVHGIIRWRPKRLADLHDFLLASEVNLLQLLQEKLKAWSNNQTLLGCQLFLIIALPKTRYGGGEIESIEVRTFITSTTISQIGTDIGLWDLLDGQPAILIGGDTSKNGNETKLATLNTIEHLSRPRAALLSGLQEDASKRIVQIGVGALGSVIFNNLIRMGYGDWTLIDEDYLLPHNLVRHALDAIWLGRSKAEALALVSDHLTRESGRTKWILANVLAPKDKVDDLISAYINADVLLDVSTSIPVARHLALDIECKAQRVSVFLNPQATDVVCLGEGIEREVTLDELEMQYYRALITYPPLHEHLSRQESRIRYAQSCRDISSSVPLDLIALHAGIASRALRKSIAQDVPHISIWSTDVDVTHVNRFDVPVSSVLRFYFGDWTLKTDSNLIDQIFEARSGRLPYETGGILLGSYDMQRRIVYVVSMLPSPTDSQEWPTSYIRGSQDLTDTIQRISIITDANLSYVGEWHSHPEGCDCSPSIDDLTAFDWLARKRELASFNADCWR